MDDLNPLDEVKKTEDSVKKEIERCSQEIEKEIFDFEQKQKDKIDNLSLILKPQIDIFEAKGKKEKEKVARKEEEKLKSELKKIDSIEKSKIEEQVNFIKDKFFSE